MNARVVAVVVTYNRKELLRECLEAIAAQSFGVQKIILVDNASTDGTFEYVHNTNLFKENLLDYRLMETNTGGAGGFAEGLKAARDMDTDWVWLMDDDTIPSSTALEELLMGSQEIGKDVSFLASSVHGLNGNPMNVPTYARENDADGALKINDATFVSVLIRKEAVLKCGLPFSEFFIWGDDTEYTMRLIKNYGPAYQIKTSEVLHKRANSGNLSIKEETDENRINMYYYFYRNILSDRKLYPSRERPFLKFYLGALRSSVTSLPTIHGLRKFAVIHRGIIDYISFKERVRTYIAEQLRHGGAYGE